MEPQSIVPPAGGLRGAKREAPLFYIPGHNGAGTFPPALASRLGQVRPCQDGLLYPGLRGPEAPANRVEDIAAHLLAQIRARCSQGPYGLCGFSFGGVVAYEVARQMQDQGLEVDTLILWDSWLFRSLTLGRRSLREGMTELVRRLGRRSAAERRQLLGRITRIKWDQAVALLREQRRRMTARALPGAAGAPHPGLCDRSAELVLQASLQAEQNYLPKPFAGNGILFHAAEEGGVFLKPMVSKGRGWAGLLQGGLEVMAIPGSHLDLWEEPGIHVLAEKTADWLRQRQGERGLASQGAARHGAPVRS